MHFRRLCLFTPLLVFVACGSSTESDGLDIGPLSEVSRQADAVDDVESTPSTTSPGPTQTPEPVSPALPEEEEPESAPPPVSCVDWEALTAEPSDVLFHPDCVVDVNIEMDATQWDALRFQTRDIIDVFYSQCLSEPPRDVFDWFEADVVVSGKSVYGVGIRKKGFYGSLSEEKPSLKLRFDRYVEGQRLAGAKRMTLNNMNQDPGLINTCLAYQLMADAGLPAPRCGFARVHVNGQDLGVYAHVDSIKTAFLERQFGEVIGNLYEGVLSDFTTLYSQTWEKKNFEEVDDWSDLDAAIEAVAAPDDALIDSLSEVFDLNAFYTFWAIEVLIGHWDGYTGNMNNFYLYADPLDGGRFRFIPWGIDSAFFDADDLNVFGEGVEVPGTVWAFGELARRLYGHPTGRVGYANALQTLLSDVWNESALSLEIDRLFELLSPHLVESEVDFFRVQLEEKRAWINRRRKVFEVVLSTELPAWDHPARASICWENKGQLTGKFDTWWGSGGYDFLTRQGELIHNIETLGTIGNVTANVREGSGAIAGDGMLEFVGSNQDGDFIVAIMFGDLDDVEPGSTVPLDWVEWSGYLGIVDPLTFRFETIGILVDGVIEFDEASRYFGEPVVGSFEAQVIQAP